ncbi:hypothetical protein F4810DRAFT_662656, partial [Camillea tinctor]
MMRRGWDVSRLAFTAVLMLACFEDECGQNCPRRIFDILTSACLWVWLGLHVYETTKNEKREKEKKKKKLQSQDYFPACTCIIMFTNVG